MVQAPSVAMSSGKKELHDLRWQKQSGLRLEAWEQVERWDLGGRCCSLRASQSLYRVLGQPWSEEITSTQYKLSPEAPNL